MYSDIVGHERKLKTLRIPCTHCGKIRGQIMGYGRRDICCTPRRLVQIYLRDGGICKICNQEVEWPGYDPDPANWTDVNRASVDHIIPRMYGGTNIRSNLRLAHQVCNSMRDDYDHPNGTGCKVFKRKPGEKEFSIERYTRITAEMMKPTNKERKYVHWFGREMNVLTRPDGGFGRVVILEEIE